MPALTKLDRLVTIASTNKLGRQKRQQQREDRVNKFKTNVFNFFFFFSKLLFSFSRWENYLDWENCNTLDKLDNVDKIRIFPAWSQSVTFHKL